jgi:hypothetical protein
VRIARTVVLAVVALGLLATPATASMGRALPKPVPCDGCWHPALRTSWQWQLQGKIDESVAAHMYDVDMFETPASTVKSLHDAGRVVVCYIDAGTWENFRPDASKFPHSVKGKPNGWPGERWLDIRRLNLLGPIMRARVATCDRKGFDGVEFDNVDGYANDTGFPLTSADQLRFDVWLANLAHRHGLAVALKNDVGQVGRLLPYFDFSLDEQCFQYHECFKLKPFLQGGKAVFEVEYKLDPAQFCPKANDMNFNSLRKRLSLKAWRHPCR